MRFSLTRTLGYFIGGVWTAWGGRKRIEARQLSRLRRLVEKVRQDSPLFRNLYSGLTESSLVELHELPVTRKPELMRHFNDWLTIRDLSRARAREHMRDISKLGVPIDEVAVFRTSGTSGEPQGNRMLSAGKSGPNPVEDALIPSGAETFAADIVFDGLVPL